jgi:hypothetical protein
MWRCTAIIPALTRLRQEDYKFKTNLSYIVRPCLKPPKYKQINMILLSYNKEGNPDICKTWMNWKALC